ncbi:pilus assembly protein PilO [Clostridium chromiireducens]|uniref:Pilus assembly protein PilO n=1 Tax=Clostridium chromiireducens TaxID=225345 RepID=A0A399ISU3_9CLOT|nr:pilus assembly protein PilO [Clostridium chromiireducens]RII36128.1 pilus assembly protein PilO [Clostridium chromiireducens]
MKISNKEKTMLCVLGSIIVGFLYYQFIYLSQVDQLQQKVSEENELKQKYDTVMNTIKSMEDKKSDVKILNAKIGDEALPFYPTINQEKIIIELDELLEDNSLKGSVTFQPIVSNSVENSKKDEKSLAESSLQAIVDQYNHAFGDAEKTQQSDDKTVTNSTKSDTNNKDSNNNGASNTNDSNNSKESGNKDSKDAKKNTVQYLKCEVNFEGKYEDLDKFLNAIAQNKKKIVVNSINVNSDTLDGVKGKINLEFYSIPKINDELEGYLKLDLNENYGKSVPFGAGTAGDTSVSKTASSGQEEKEPSDFIALVKPTASDLPTITIGKAKDDLRTSYVYADSNSVENVEMLLTQDGDKYYYKYKTSKGTFPANYDGLGAEFVPTSKNMVLDILSRSRLDANDNSGMKLKIVNKTDKLLKVNITGEDSNSPRVTVEGDLNNVSVSNK